MKGTRTSAEEGGEEMAWFAGLLNHRIAELSRLVRVFIQQIRDQVGFLGVIFQPGANPFDFFVIIAEPGLVHLLEKVLGFEFANLFLPGLGEDQVDLVVDFVFFEDVPLVLVEPDAVAGVAPVEVKIYVGPDFVPAKQTSAVGADFGFFGLGVGDGGRGGGVERGRGGLLVLELESQPEQVFVRREPVSVSVRAGVDGELIFEEGELEGGGAEGAGFHGK